MHLPARHSSPVVLTLALLLFGMLLPQAAGFASAPRDFDRTGKLIQVLAAPIGGPNLHSPWRQWLPATFRPRR